MKLGYVRVSTLEQNEKRQLELLEKHDVEKFFIDKCSGRTANRKSLIDLKEFCRENDIIYIESFSRLARSTNDLLDLVEFFHNKNVALVSLKENLDTGTAAGKMMLTIISAISQFEVECLRERQIEGIQIAKREGKYKGRKKIEFPENFKEVYEKYLKREWSAVYCMEVLGLKKNTFYNLKKKYEENINNKIDINVQIMN